MLVTSAIQLIANLIYKPGWSFEATDHTNRFEGCICLKITYPARESGRPDAYEDYPNANRPYASFPIQVSELDDVKLYKAVIQIIMQIEEHEAREFLRIAPTMWAPFHPHNIDGMKRWGKPRIDLQFGLA